MQPRHAWLWIVASVLAFLAGLARLWLGVQFPWDVIVGWLMEGAALAATIV